MAQTDGLELPIGVTERQFVQQLTRLEARMAKAEAANTQRFQRSNRQVSNSFRNMSVRASGSLNSIDLAATKAAASVRRMALSFAGGLVGGAAVGLLGGFRRSIRDVVAEAAGIADVADRVGIGIEALQGLQHGFQIAGFSADEFNAALTRFTRRVGEAVHGGGPLQTTLDRYRISVRGANGEMKSQIDLLREVSEAIRRAGTDQEQLAIAQAAFGDVGRRMVNALRNGAGGIDEMIIAAEEAGAVLDEELIRKAEEIDRKFAELSAAAAAFSKRLIVGLVVAGAEAREFKRRLDDIVTEGEGRAIFGDRFYDQMEANEALLERNVDAAQALTQEYDGLAAGARRTSDAMMDALLMMNDAGGDAANSLRGIQAGLQSLLIEWDEQQIEAAEFTNRLEDLEKQATDAITELSAADRVTFSGVVAQLGSLRGAVAGVIGLARQMHTELAFGADAISRQFDDGKMIASAVAEYNAMIAANRRFEESERDLNSATSEQLRLQREMASVRKDMQDSGLDQSYIQANEERVARARIAADDARRAADQAARAAARDAGKESKGKKERLDEYEREAKAIRDRTEALEIEAQVMLSVAGTSVEYADALEFAAQKARLLTAAQREGMRITPELEAEIDALAEAYVTAGMSAEDAAEKLDRIKGASERGKDALENMFGSIIDGSKSAGDAVADLLREIAKAQMIKGIMGLPGMDGLSNTVGRLLGYDEGGYTGHGGKYEPAGIVHRGEYVMDAETVRRAGGPAVFDALRAGLKGYANGGYVAPSIPAMPPRGAGGAAPEVSVHIHENAVEGPHQVRQSPGRIDVLLTKQLGDMVRGGGLDSAFGQRFGMRPRPAGG